MPERAWGPRAPALCTGHLLTPAPAAAARVPALLLAVSGGQDSTALLGLLLGLRRLHGWRLRAVARRPPLARPTAARQAGRAGRPGATPSAWSWRSKPAMLARRQGPAAKPPATPRPRPWRLALPAAGSRGPGSPGRSRRGGHRPHRQRHEPRPCCCTWPAAAHRRGLASLRPQRPAGQHARCVLSRPLLLFEPRRHRAASASELHLPVWLDAERRATGATAATACATTRRPSSKQLHPGRRGA
jgi:tRNA(Ile)-lysidine synthase